MRFMVHFADTTYIIALNDEPEAAKAILLLAAGLAVDVIYKER